ncbi:MAG TPA: hypothetical protein VGB14_20150 [Acidimicrobiales bacterium]
MSGREARQREELAGLERALQVFDDPDTATRPGMQLMRDAIQGKRDKMAAKLAEEAQVRLEVVVGGVPAAGGTLDPAFLVALAGAVPEAVTSAVGALAGDLDPAPAGAALVQATAVRVAGTPDDGPGLVLVGPPAEVRAAVPAADGPLLDAALAAVVDDPAPLARLAASAGATLRLTLHLPFEDDRTVHVGA